MIRFCSSFSIGINQQLDDKNGQNQTKSGILSLFIPILSTKKGLIMISSLF
jgi:hypothetical protein